MRRRRGGSAHPAGARQDASSSTQVRVGAARRHTVGLPTQAGRLPRRLLFGTAARGEETRARETSRREERVAAARRRTAVADEQQLDEVIVLIGRPHLPPRATCGCSSQDVQLPPQRPAPEGLFEPGGSLCPFRLGRKNLHARRESASLGVAADLPWSPGSTRGASGRAPPVSAPAGWLHTLRVKRTNGRLRRGRGTQSTPLAHTRYDTRKVEDITSPAPATHHGQNSSNRKLEVMSYSDRHS